MEMRGSTLLFEILLNILIDLFRRLICVKWTEFFQPILMDKNLMRSSKLSLYRTLCWNIQQSSIYSTPSKRKWVSALYNSVVKQKLTHRHFLNKFQITIHNCYLRKKNLQLYPTFDGLARGFCNCCVLWILCLDCSVHYKKNFIILFSIVFWMQLSILAIAHVLNGPSTSK